MSVLDKRRQENKQDDTEERDVEQDEDEEISPEQEEQHKGLSIFRYIL